MRRVTWSWITVRIGAYRSNGRTGGKGRVQDRNCAQVEASEKSGEVIFHFKMPRTPQNLAAHVFARPGARRWRRCALTKDRART